jgi:tRNA threonylcarbamoyladenosine biosynthesis protein TsaB
MAFILLLESSTTNCSVGLAKDDKLIAHMEANEGYSHSENMAAFAKEVLEQGAIEFTDLDAIAVGKGPGSYTGLRIGVSLAKGIAFASEIPIISLESLEVIAAACEHKAQSDDLIIPMTDARRMEVYSAIYDSNLKRLNDIEATILDDSSFEENLKAHRCIFCGDGSTKFKEICKHPNAVFVDAIFPSVQFMSKLAFKKFEDGAFEDTAYFEPYYLKEFIAIKPKKLF